jgi:hypothetical protein
MIPFLPDLSASPSPAAALPREAGATAMPDGALGAGAGEGRPPLDFAELLDAALPGARVALPLADADAAVAAPAEAPPVMRPLTRLSPGLKLASDGRLPGSILPEGGADLPPPAPLDAPHAERAMIAPPPPPAPAPAPEPEDAPLPEAAVLALLPVAPAVLVPAAGPAGAEGGDPACAPAPAAPMLAPLQGRGAPRLAPLLPPEPAGEDAPERAATAPLYADASEPARQPAAPAPAAPLAPQPAAPALAQPAQPLTPAPLAAAPEPRSPAPGQESAIAQVGEIREALRSVRPEMMLRHAEFGFVSLRLEGTSAAPQDWRAVLASRDPGFVPAIQAALAERTVAASPDTASTGTGTGTGAQAGGHMGAGSSPEQRYGFSQGGGQGSSSPYPGHSGQRDEGASPHQRNPQHGRADESAAAAGTPDSEASGHRRRGLFA